MQSHSIDLDGPLHYADFGGAGTTAVLVHGLGGSHLNWGAAAPLLARSMRVVAPDLAGFGRSAPAGRSSAVRANRALLDRFIDAVSDEPVILVGNSMGGLISLMEASLRPEKVAALVLVDPALPRANGSRPDALVAAAFAAYAVPGVGERFVRYRAASLGPEGIVRQTLQMCCVDPDRVPADLVAAHVDLARWRMTAMPEAHRTFLEAARSLLSVIARRNGFRQMARGVSAPTLLVHGARDRLVPLAAAREIVAARPEWTLEVLDDIGHTPQMEAPERFADIVATWLDGVGVTEQATPATTKRASARATRSRGAGTERANRG